MADKHDEDGGDINRFVTDDGDTVLVCSKCGATWINGVVPVEEADRSRRTRLSDSLQRHRSMYEDAGVEVDEVVAQLKGD